MQSSEAGPVVMHFVSQPFTGQRQNEERRDGESRSVGNESRPSGPSLIPVLPSVCYKADVCSAIC